MPAEPAKPLRIFLSYAHADVLSARKLYESLREKGFEVWFDKDNLFPAHHWRLEINEGLNNSDVVIACLSKASVSETGSLHGQVKFAVERALEMQAGRIFLIAVRLEDCKAPDSLSSYHKVDLFRQEDGLNLLDEELQRCAAQPRYTRPAPAPNLDPIPPVSVGKTTQRNPSDGDAPAIGKRRVAPTRSPHWERLEKVGVFLGTVLFFLGVGGLLLWFGNSVFVPVASFAVDAPPKIATRTPVAGGGMLSKKDGMMLRYVPAGEFTMGSAAEAELTLCLTLRPNCRLDSFEDETPPHKVYIDAFWIDETEVTTRMYALCVAASVCQTPAQKWLNILLYYDNPEYADYPVFHVTWDQAEAYCKWAGRELPNEAQWEKAARGTDERAYAWGNNIPNINFSNYGSYGAGPTRVGKYRLGASPYGVLDMAGNLWEWVYDWYTVYPGGNSSASPDFGQKYRVVRGGDMRSDRFEIRTTLRNRYAPDNGYDNVGFRCALLP